MEHKCSTAEERIRRAVQAKLGEAIRSSYELARPLPDRLYALAKELERATATTSDRANEPKPVAGEPAAGHTGAQGSDGRP